MRIIHRKKFEDFQKKSVSMGAAILDLVQVHTSREINRASWENFDKIISPKVVPALWEYTGCITVNGNSIRHGGKINSASFIKAEVAI